MFLSNFFPSLSSGSGSGGGSGVAWEGRDEQRHDDVSNTLGRPVWVEARTFWGVNVDTGVTVAYISARQIAREWR